MAFDNDDNILSLIDEFSNKVKSGDKLLFYDEEDWLDIIDFFFIENEMHPLLKIAIRHSIAQYPNNVDIIVRKAEFLSFTNPKKALTYLVEERKKLNDKKDITLLLYQSSKILTELGSYVEACKLTDTCLANEINEYICTLYAIQNIKLHKFNKAKSHLFIALNLCFHNYTKEEIEEIKSYGANDFMYSNTIIPDNLLSTIAELCKEMPQYKNEFYKTLEKFVEHDPQNADYWEMLAEFYERCNEYEKAIEACDYFLFLEPNDLYVTRKKYINYITNGGTNERAKLLKRICTLTEEKLKGKNISDKIRIEFNETLTTTYFELINVLFTEKKYNECIETCEEILKKAQKIPLFSKEVGFTKSTIYYMISRSEFKLDNIEKSIIFAEKAIEAEPQNISARINLAELLHASGLKEEAYEIYNDLFYAFKENIEDEESRDIPDMFVLETMYFVLTSIVTSWSKVLYNDDEKMSLMLLENVAYKLLLQRKIDSFQECLTSIILVYTDIIFEKSLPKEELESLIKESIRNYGATFLEDLETKSLNYQEKNIKDYLHSITKQIKENEELH